MPPYLGTKTHFTGLVSGIIFLVTKIFPSLLTTLHPYGTYWGFAVVCLLTRLGFSTVKCPPPHVYNTVQYYCHNYILIKEKYI
jgi:hypothetical protein